MKNILSKLKIKLEQYQTTIPPGRYILFIATQRSYMLLLYRDLSPISTRACVKYASGKSYAADVFPGYATIT